jgi:CheY-like chemotaxis protein
MAIKKPPKRITVNQPPFLLYIVDDDEDDLLFIHNAFKAVGFDNVCKGFYNGGELMQHLKFKPAEEMPDVIVLDYEMPKMNGKQVLKQLRSLPDFFSTPVIFYSDRIDEKLESELKELGAFCCIKKGITPVEQVNFAKAVTEFLKK